MPFTKFRKEYKRIPWKTGRLICFWGTSFPRGSLMRIPMETYSACDFPGGLDLCPPPPLGPPMLSASRWIYTFHMFINSEMVAGVIPWAGRTKKRTKKSNPWRLVLVLESSQSAHNLSRDLNWIRAVKKDWYPCLYGSWCYFCHVTGSYISRSCNHKTYICVTLQ